jgi:hypothetical protein
MSDRDNSGLIYSIRLSIRHPRIDPDLVTAKLGLTPHVSQAVGKYRKTRTGAPLPGTHKETAWAFAYDVEGKRSFLKEVAELVSRLKAKAAFLHELTDTGGSIAIYVHLPGNVNIGDVIRWQDLEQMVALRINFGVEVFPDFGPIAKYE